MALLDSVQGFMPWSLFLLTKASGVGILQKYKLVNLCGATLTIFPNPLQFIMGSALNTVFEVHSNNEKWTL
jgi:hypothetical protein